MSMYEKRVSFILGPPLAGKGTQSEKLMSEFGCVHLSTGDLLRQERKSGSELGEMIESYIAHGRLVPGKTTVDLLLKAMSKTDANRFIIDGFPRNFDNLQGWHENMSDIKVDNVIYLDCPEQELKRRLIVRSNLLGRSDDNIEAFGKRMTVFQESTLPVISHFSDKGLLYHIKAGDRGIEDVYSEMRQYFEPLILRDLNGDHHDDDDDANCNNDDDIYQYNNGMCMGDRKGRVSSIRSTQNAKQEKLIS